MFNVLIVDDDQYTREGIRDLILWKELGVDSVTIASDGLEGLKICDQIKPDLIISDIKMPNINGINFIEQIRSSQPFCQIIFISAYTDKEYFKSAISLKVSRYVEKPINLEELTSAIREALQSLKVDRTFQNTSIHLQDIALNLIKSQQDQFLLIEKIKWYCPEFLDCKQYYCALAEINDINMTELQQTEIYDLLLKEIKLNFNYVLPLKSEHNRVILHICNKHIYNIKRVLDILSNIIYLINHSYNKNNSMFISIGKPVTTLNEICYSYSGVLLGMRQLFFLGYDFAVSPNNIAYKEYSFDRESLKLFSTALIRANRETAISIISTCINHAQQCRGSDPIYVKNSLLKYDVEITEAFLHRSTYEDDKKKFEQTYSTKYIPDCNTLKEITKYLLNKLNYYYDYLELFKQNRHIYTIIRFIEENYSIKTLSINQIADSIYLTPAHICHIFKNEMGTTVNRYITDFRINKAKELLKEKDFKLIEIAEKAGFSDANYFARTFKKITGITPTQYKEIYLK